MLDGIDNYCFCFNLSGGYKSYTTCWAIEYNVCCFLGQCEQPIRSRYPNTCSCCCYFCYPKENNARPIRTISDWRGNNRSADLRSIQQEPDSVTSTVTIEDLGSQLLMNGKTEMKPVAEVLRNTKLVGLYFSAHWCDPCKAFTPLLAETYEKLNAGPKGKVLEVVFISSDHNEPEFDEYFRTMPWLAIPYKDNKEALVGLQSKLCASGIPSLLIVDASAVTSGSEMRIVDKDGRSSVQSAKGDVRKLMLSWGIDQLDA